MGGFDVGLRAEYTGYDHPLGLDLTVDLLGIAQKDFDFNITHHEVKFLLQLSF